jgi:uncharacterized protein
MNGEYRAVLQKVEAFTAAVEARRAADFACSPGCAACCESWLTVSAVEAAEVRDALARLPAEQRSAVRERGVRELAREAQGEQAQRCAMLEEDGRCSVYDSRPLICRTQGHALRYPNGLIPAEAIMRRLPHGEVTWCPLNYEEDKPQAEDILDAERVDQLLSLVARRHASACGIALEHRLALSALAAEADVLHDEAAHSHDSANAPSRSE